jgi:hypothetical protein
VKILPEDDCRLRACIYCHPIASQTLVLVTIAAAAHAPVDSFDGLNELLFAIHALELCIANDSFRFILSSVIFHLLQDFLGFLLRLFDLFLVSISALLLITLLFF